MTDRYISLIARFLSGDLADQEREELFGLINSTEEHKVFFEEMERLWELDLDDSTDNAINTDLAWQKVAGRINPVVSPKKDDSSPKIFKIGPLIRIAAVLIGLAAAIWFLVDFGPNQQMAEYRTIENEKKEIILPDGSKVWLNENSSLTYDESFKTRMVELKGEGFFDVKHLENNDRFEIKSGDTRTVVLGTSFNVRAYPDEEQVEVTVATGKVLFEKDKKATLKEKVILTPGESGVFEKKQAVVVKAEKVISNANAWKTGELNFDNTKFSEVVDVLERYFDVVIEIENPEILNCPYTGSHKEPKINELLEVLKFAMDLQVNKTNNSYILSGGTGC